MGNVDFEELGFLLELSIVLASGYTFYSLISLNEN